jgi:hypothetical protein
MYPRSRHALGVYLPKVQKVGQQRQFTETPYTLPASGPWAKIKLTELGEVVKGTYGSGVTFEIKRPKAVADPQEIKFSEGRTSVVATLTGASGERMDVTVGSIKYAVNMLKNNLTPEHADKIRKIIEGSPELFNAIRDVSAYGFWAIDANPLLLMLPTMLYMDLSQYYPQSQKTFTQPPGSVKCKEDIAAAMPGVLITPFSMFGISGALDKLGKGSPTSMPPGMDAMVMIEGAPGCTFPPPVKPSVSAPAAQTGGLTISDTQLKVGGAIIAGLLAGYLIFKKD